MTMVSVDQASNIDARLGSCVDLSINQCLHPREFRFEVIARNDIGEICAQLSIEHRPVGALFSPSDVSRRQCPQSAKRKRPLGASWVTLTKPCLGAVTGMQGLGFGTDHTVVSNQHDSAALVADRTGLIGRTDHA